MTYGIFGEPGISFALFIQTTINFNKRRLIMNFKTLLTAASISFFMSGGMASAATLPSFDAENIKFGSTELHENIVTQVGDVLAGFGTVASIGSESDVDKYHVTASTVGSEFTYVFGGLTVAEITGTGSQTDPFALYFTGGTLDIYWGDPGDANAVTGTGYDDGVHVLGLDFMAGYALDLGNGGFDESTATLYALFNGGFDLEHPSGSGFGYLAVREDGTGGLWADIFNSDRYDEETGGNGGDFFLESSYSDQGTGLLPVVGTASLQGRAIPEPAMLGLFGIGLLGLGFARRRK